MMTHTASVIARIIALQGREAVIVYGDAEQAVQWPDDALAAIVGGVYQVTFDPFTVIASLTDDIPQPWRGEEAMRWRQRDAAGITRMALLWQRHQIRRAVRDYLDSQHFIEIDAPLLVRGTTPDAGLDTFLLSGGHNLVTSTEYQIKRLEIGGFDRIYTLTQNFRVEEIAGVENRFRNPEFTMLEWARVGADLSAIEHDLEQMVCAAAKAIDKGATITYQGQSIDLTPPWERLSVAEAIGMVTGFTPPDFTAASIFCALNAVNITPQAAWEDDVVFAFTVLLDHIQPHLGTKKPVFLQDWPAFLSASAENNAKPEHAVRSEAFIAGVELSDGFPSLTSLPRQLQGFAAQQQRRAAEGKDTMPLDNMFLKAMLDGFPSGAGMAMGFDRLVMLLTDQPHIRRVLAFHWDEL